jgi:GMP reductase
MRIESDIKLDFTDVLLRPKRSTLSSRKDVTLEKTVGFLHSPKVWEGVPIFAANMDTVGTFSMARELYKNKMLVCLHKFYTAKEVVQFADENKLVYEQSVVISSGIQSADCDRLNYILARTNPAMVCLDVANGYTERFVNTVRQTRKDWPEQIIVAGNVVTREMTEELLLAGADIIKCGIGSGSACTTRIKTGVGYPQLSTVIECADAAHGLRGMIVSDGGCTNSGDVSKAFGAGADFVMLGGMLAGHDESETDQITIDGKQYCAFYGMSSSTAMNKYFGTVANYRASEGRTLNIEYRGQVSDTISDVLGGIRSACTYIGARCIKDVPKCTTFIRVNQQYNTSLLK